MTPTARLAIDRFNLVAIGFTLLLCERTLGQSLIDLDRIPTSGLKLEIRKFAQLPRDPGNVMVRPNFLTTAPGDDRLFLMTHGYNMSGVSTARVFAVDPDAPGGPQAGVFLPLGQVLNNVNGPIAGTIEHTREGGGRTIAFHPDFATPGTPGYRKFYTAQMEKTAFGNPALPYVGPTSPSDNIADSVIGEWTMGNFGFPDATTYREVLRVALPWFAHPAQTVAFNPYSRPGDEDYGLLYFSHGDSGLETTGTGQNGLNVLGKVLRINPLQNGASSYTVSTTNPFTGASDPANLVRDEVYALGFRNPNRFSWVQDDQGGAHMILSDIGDWNVEEINVVEAGGNYGWRVREGTFAQINQGENKGIGFGITNLPSNDAALNDFVYPAAQYGHLGTVGTHGLPTSVVGGYVIQHGPLQGQYIFGDFPETGILLHTSLSDLLNAKTKLADGESPTSLSPATIQRLGVLFDHDDNPVTPPLDTTMREVIRNDPAFEGGERVEIGFGQGPNGELYIINKRNTWIYLVTNSVPADVLGDYNGNGVVEAADFVLWRKTLGSTTDLRANGDNTGESAGVIDAADYQYWSADFGKTVSFGTGVAVAAVPESTYITLFFACVFCGLARTRRAGVTGENCLTEAATRRRSK
jgi:hypothetical protein